MGKGRAWFAYPRCMVSRELLTTQEVATVLGVTAARVRQLVRDGRIHPESYSPRVHLFRREVVEDYRAAPKLPRGRPRNA